MAGGSGIAAGASAGAAFGPWGAAIGGVAGGLMDAFGGGGGGGAPPAPQNASGAVYGSGLDGSGWNVNFAGVQSNGSNKQATPDSSAASELGLSAPGAGVSPLMTVAVVAMLGLALWSRSKR